MKILIIGSGAREVAISTKLLGDNDNIIIHNMSTYENIDMAAISEKIIIIDDYSIDSLGFNIDLMNNINYLKTIRFLASISIEVILITTLNVV